MRVQIVVCENVHQSAKILSCLEICTHTHTRTHLTHARITHACVHTHTLHSHTYRHPIIHSYVYILSLSLSLSLSLAVSFSHCTRTHTLLSSSDARVARESLRRRARTWRKRWRSWRTASAPTLPDSSRSTRASGPSSRAEALTPTTRGRSRCSSRRTLSPPTSEGVEQGRGIEGQSDGRRTCVFSTHTLHTYRHVKHTLDAPRGQRRACLLQVRGQQPGSGGDGARPGGRLLQRGRRGRRE